METWRRSGFALYVHWPFCQAKCPYCDFNSHVAREIDQAAWARAYADAIALAAADLPGRSLSSIFFGGGTPSLMPPETVGRVIEAARAGWAFDDDIEITLEANPTSVEAGRFAGFRDAGVNRVSVGVQALNDNDLRRLGRLHGRDEAIRAVETAQAVFPRTSFDLIYARQGQEAEAWRRELTEALSMAGEHLSLYQLTVEPGTVFGARHARGHLRGLPDEDLSADLYDITAEMTANAGLPAYEISNHARPGAESRHNLVYWRGGDWVGIGPGAHGRHSRDGVRWATTAPADPATWLSAVASGTDPREAVAVPAAEAAAERLMMGLRLAGGINLDEAETRYLDPGGVAAMADLGFLSRDGGHIAVTPAGRPLTNRVTAEVLAGV